MERRTAVVAAATASLTLLAGAAAISLNTGIVGASGDDGAGQISPVDATTTPPATIYIDEPGAANQTTATPQGSTEAPSAASSASRSGDDDHYENDGGDHEHEYEGADDDD